MLLMVALLHFLLKLLSRDWRTGELAHLDQRITMANGAPRRYLAMSGEHFGCHDWVVDIPQCTGQPPHHTELWPTSQLC